MEEKLRRGIMSLLTGGVIQFYVFQEWCWQKNMWHFLNILSGQF
jgi:hypothetical protein